MHGPNSLQTLLEMLSATDLSLHPVALLLFGPGARRGQPEALRELFNRPDAQLVMFRGREGLVAPAEQPAPAAADAAAAATPDSQATWQQPDLK